jgi:hypothetical protein
MKNLLKFVSLLFLLSAMVISCNPECETLISSNIQAPMGPYAEDTQIAISAAPPEILEGRTIHLSARDNNNRNSMVQLISRFETQLGALVVDIPVGVTSNATLLIDDPDCSGQMIPIGNPTEVVDPAFFVDNPLFVTPIPPIIIIPTPPVVVPTNVVNAWFSPNNRDYCIWFNPVILDTLPDGTVVEGTALIPAGSPSGIGPKNGSVELAAGCSGNLARTDRFYHDNPVSGIVDKENNFIRIRIDRTSKGLGIEAYEGEFISPDKVPVAYTEGGICASNGDEEPFFMFLTSTTTGRQLILFRQPI